MSELLKLAAAGGLIVAGFCSASLFNLPTPSQQAVRQSERPLRVLDPIDPSASLWLDESNTHRSDPNLALATHVDSPPDEPARMDAMAADRRTQLAWNAMPDPAAPATHPLPEIRRRATTNGDDWGSTAVRGPAVDDRFSSLAPPPLMSPEASSGRTRSGVRFPDPPPTAAAQTTPPRAGAQEGGFASWPAAGAHASESSPPLIQGDTWSMSRPLPPRTAPPRGVAADPVWHVVSDGDSLTALAARYLRNATRAREIYELNRDVLENPDLLPIGVELRIPERGVATPPVEVFDSRGMARGEFEPQRQLVPLPQLPAGAAMTPRARLQPPRPASFANQDHN